MGERIGGVHCAGGLTPAVHTWVGGRAHGDVPLVTVVRDRLSGSHW